MFSTKLERKQPNFLFVLCVEWLTKYILATIHCNLYLWYIRGQMFRKEKKHMECHDETVQG